MKMKNALAVLKAPTIRYATRWSEMSRSSGPGGRVPSGAGSCTAMPFSFPSPAASPGDYSRRVPEPRPARRAPRSVVIPVYRGEQHLPRVLDELAQFTAEMTTPGGAPYRVAEVLLVHDCGPDDSARVMRELAAEAPVRAADLAEPQLRPARGHPGRHGLGGRRLDRHPGRGRPARPGRSSRRMLDVALAEQASVVYARPTNQPPHGACATRVPRRQAAGQGAQRRRGRVGLPQLPADPRRGRPQRRGVRRVRGLPRRRPRLGRRPGHHGPVDAARGGRARVRLLRPQPAVALLADGAHQRHPRAARGQRPRRPVRAARLPARGLPGRPPAHPSPRPCRAGPR